MDGEAIRQWLAVLDSISYYDIFRVQKTATYDELRTAFHAFAESFHPDVHGWRHPQEKAAVGYIFKRGTEAYRVLSDPNLRARYDEALASGILRPEQLVVDMDGGHPSSSRMPVGSPLAGVGGAGPTSKRFDKMRHPGARTFVARAEELFKKGDPKQAKIQLVMAMHMDKGNEALEALAKELDEAIKAKAEEQKNAWKKP